MELLNKLFEMGKKYSILYVEDDKRLQIETQKVLNRIFREVHTADDGDEGLKCFETAQIDMVLTDIEMPNMNGLKMSEHIKQIQPECPIVVLSAYSNSDYFIEAIEYSIDHYVLKPINTDRLLETLLKVCNRLEDKRMAVEYKEQQIKQQINDEKYNMLSQISNTSPNPMLVYCDGELTFFNESFNRLFDGNSLREQIGKELDLERFFNEKFVSDEVLREQPDIMKPFSIGDLTAERKIALQTNDGKKIFLVLKSPFELQEKGVAALYTLNDITKLQYQQIQLENFNKNLSQTIEENFVAKQPKNDGIINKVDFTS